MRDDLHKTVSLPHRWRGVVFAVCNHLPDEEIARRIISTAQTEITLDETIEGCTVAKLLQGEHPDLWKDDADDMRKRLLAVSNSNISLATRHICETALGVLAIEGCQENFAHRVLAEARSGYAQNEIEHLVSFVARQCGVREAIPLLNKLRQVFAQCSFDKPASKIREKKSAEDLLNMDLGLMLEGA